MAGWTTGTGAKLFGAKCSDVVVRVTSHLLRTVQELGQQAHEGDELQRPLGIVLDQLVRPRVPEPRDGTGEQHHVATLLIPVAVVG